MYVRIRRPLNVSYYATHVWWAHENPVLPTMHAHMSSRKFHVHVYVPISRFHVPRSTSTPGRACGLASGCARAHTHPPRDFPHAGARLGREASPPSSAPLGCAAAGPRGGSAGYCCCSVLRGAGGAEMPDAGGFKKKKEEVLPRDTILPYGESLDLCLGGCVCFFFCGFSFPLVFFPSPWTGPAPLSSQLEPSPPPSPSGRPCRRVPHLLLRRGEDSKLASYPGKRSMGEGNARGRRVGFLSARRFLPYAADISGRYPPQGGPSGAVPDGNLSGWSRSSATCQTDCSVSVSEPRGVELRFLCKLPISRSNSRGNIMILHGSLEAMTRETGQLGCLVRSITRTLASHIGVMGPGARTAKRESVKATRLKGGKRNFPGARDLNVYFLDVVCIFRVQLEDIHAVQSTDRIPKMYAAF
jgi:hypothetical protein